MATAIDNLVTNALAGNYKTFENQPQNTWVTGKDIARITPTKTPIEGGEYQIVDPLSSVRPQFNFDEPWFNIIRQLGFTGPLKTAKPATAEVTDPADVRPSDLEQTSPQARAFIDSLKAKGYDIAVDANTVFDKTTKYALLSPSGEILHRYEGNKTSLLETVAPMILMAAGAYGLNALAAGGTSLGGATTAANLAGGSADLIPGVMGGGQFAAAGAVPESLLASSVGGGVTETLNTLPYTSGATSYPVGEFAGTTSGGLPSANLVNVSSDLYGGSADLAGAMGGGAFEAAATPYVAPPLTGADAAMADVAASAPVTPTTAPTDFLAGMSDVAATEGPGVAGTGILTAGTNIPSAVAGGSLLGDAVKFITSPAGSALVNAGANLVGGITSASAATDAARIQAESADKALKFQREMYEKFMDMNRPYYEAGVNALGKITRGEVQTEPGYGFRLGEGMKALERVQAARGGLLSGGAIKAGQRYAQDFASGEYGNAYNRLANLAGLGQTASSQAGTMGQNYATAAGNLGLQGANALTQGRIGRTSSYTNALMGVGQALAGYGAQQQQNDYMNRLLDIYGQRVGG